MLSGDFAHRRILVAPFWQLLSSNFSSVILLVWGKAGFQSKSEGGQLTKNFWKRNILVFFILTQGKILRGNTVLIWSWRLGNTYYNSTKGAQSLRDIINKMLILVRLEQCWSHLMPSQVKTFIEILIWDFYSSTTTIFIPREQMFDLMINVLAYRRTYSSSIIDQKQFSRAVARSWMWASTNFKLEAKLALDQCVQPHKKHLMIFHRDKINE